MRETKETKKKEDQKPKKQKGITLIALIISIIIMILLVAVLVTNIINGGMFEKAGSAASRTESEKLKEQNLADGKINVENTVYNSIDKYIEGLKQNDGRIEPEDINDWMYDVEDDGTVTIKKYLGTASKLIIPNYIKGRPVKTIGGETEGMFSPILMEDTEGGPYRPSTNRKIEEIIIPEGITVINNRAFVYAAGLKKITLPESLYSIGDYAFAYTYSLENIKIPASVQMVGGKIFMYSEGIQVDVSWDVKPEGWSDNWAELKDAAYDPWT